MFGMRIIKSGIAVVIAAFVSQLFHFHTPFFVCMTAFITMEKTLLTSLQLGRNRVVGTAIGAIIGGFLSLFFAGNAIITGIAVMLCIKICTKLNLHGAIFISGIVCIACILHVDEGVGIYYAYARTIQSFAGMLISIVINLILLPYYNIDRIKHLEDDVINSLLYNQDNIQSCFDKLETTIELYKKEIMKPQKKQRVKHYEERLKRLKTAKLHYDIISTIDDAMIISYHKNEKLKILKELS